MKWGYLALIDNFLNPYFLVNGSCGMNSEQALWGFAW